MLSLYRPDAEELRNFDSWPSVATATSDLARVSGISDAHLRHPPYPLPHPPISLKKAHFVAGRPSSLSGKTLKATWQLGENA
jgi:hypothetical protein